MTQSRRHLTCTTWWNKRPPQRTAPQLWVTPTPLDDARLWQQPAVASALRLGSATARRPATVVRAACPRGLRRSRCAPGSFPCACCRACRSPEWFWRQPIVAGERWRHVFSHSRVRSLPSVPRRSTRATQVCTCSTAQATTPGWPWCACLCSRLRACLLDTDCDVRVLACAVSVEPPTPHGALPLIRQQSRLKRKRHHKPAFMHEVGGMRLRCVARGRWFTRVSLVCAS